MTMFPVPTARHATFVETSVERVPTHSGNPLPTPGTVVARCPGRVSMVGAWYPAGNAQNGLRQNSFWRRCCTGRGGALVRFSPSTNSFNSSVLGGTTGVVGNGPHEPGLAIMVGAWFPAGNAPRVGLRQFSSGRCCTGRWDALVFFSPASNIFNLPVLKGTTGAAGNGIGKKQLSKREVQL